MIGPKTTIADRPHRVTLQNPGPAVPDGEGGTVQSWTDLTPPALSVKIAEASTANLERVTTGTVLATATHVITGPYHPQVTTQTRILFQGRSFSVTGVSNPGERNVEMILVCKEVVL